MSSPRRCSFYERVLNAYADLLFRVMRVLTSTVAVVAAVVLCWVVWLMISSITATR